MSVYFVTCREANAVKIGYSGDASVRVKEIQCGCPLPVKLEAVIPGTITTEHQLHARFADDRMCGEWFKLNPVIEGMIAGNPAPQPAAKGDPQYYRKPRFDTFVSRVRAHLRCTQIELAEMIGVEPKVIRKYEHARRAPTPPELREKLSDLIRDERSVRAARRGAKA